MMRFSARFSPATFVLSVLAILPTLFAQGAKNHTAADDWPMYNRDLAGTRYSPLTQINVNNVAQLALAWSYRPTGAGQIPTQATPLVVNGVMYLPAGDGVVALEPETGREIWRYHLERNQIASYRGVAYWPGDPNTVNGSSPPRILFTAAPGGTAPGSAGLIHYRQLTALNANTGKLDPGFGKEGQVDMGVAYGGVPTIFKNVIVVGAYAQEHAPLGIPGDTRAYDARTGAKLWDFHAVPRPGEIGNDTWAGDSWRDRSGTNVWGFQMTADQPRGLFYMNFGAPSSTFYGGDRHGANLFGNALVAIDAQTGKYKWHFQTIHHDIWDYDLPPAPGLIDIVQNGRKIPALVQVGKTGLVFILDRVTGKPVFGVEERPVPKSDVPGEETSPTQPFPLKPPPLARLSYQPEDMVTAADTTAEHAKECQDLVERSGGVYNQGPFTPWLFRPDGAPPRSTILFPGINGGTNWGGTATDPKSGYVYVFTQERGNIGWIQKYPNGYRASNEISTLLYGRASEAGDVFNQGFEARVTGPDGRLLPGRGWPCQKPPWGRLSAINANTGEIAWQTTVGVTDELPEGKRKTGRLGLAGPMVTAGGLVFLGATDDGRFRAFDAKTGKELWVTNLGYTASAIPMTFRGRNGKQYVAVIAAGPPTGSATSNKQGLMVFSLP